MATKLSDTLLIGIDFSRGEDVGVIIAGRKKPGKDIDIVNAFQGHEGWELYQRLIGAKKGEEDGEQ